MRPAKDPLYRTACQIHGRLQALAAARIRPHEQPLQSLADVCGLFDRSFRRRKLAGQHGWEFAARTIHADLLHRVRQIQDFARSIPLDGGERPVTPPLSVLYPELRQLYREFEEVEIDLDHHVVSAATQPVELEGIELGAFSIELHMDQLVARPDSYCFRLVALDPHPAYSNPSVTHPHVQEQRLCAGDASWPIQSALAGGRLCEAFLLVRAVLNTYNAESPYVSLRNWGGVRCADCDASVSRDELYCCAECQRRVCGECIGVCNVCQRSCCTGCLELDEVSARDCCPNCRQLCASCGRTVDANNIDADSGLCPQCVAENEEDEPDDGPTTSSDPLPATTLPQPTGGIMTLVCSCAADENYPDNVYAVLQLTAEQARVLLGLRGVFEAARALSPDFPVRAVQVWDPRPDYVTALRDEYEDACPDLTEWHAIAIDPSSAGMEAHLDGDALLVTEDGLRWQVNPSHNGYSLIETDTLRWEQLERLAAGEQALPLLGPEGAGEDAASTTGTGPQRVPTAAA